jgi:hypothetical protein
MSVKATKRAISLPGTLDAALATISRDEQRSFSSVMQEAARVYLRLRKDATVYVFPRLRDISMEKEQLSSRDVARVKRAQRRGDYAPWSEVKHELDGPRRKKCAKEPRAHRRAR